MFSAVFLLLLCFRSFIFTETRNFSNNEFTEDENRQYIKEEGLTVDDNRNSIDIPGIYPTYTTIPGTGFSCKGKILLHYYADIETDCQVFHICESEYAKISFVCPVGSIFNQRHLICDWFYNFDCSTAEGFYPSGNEFNEQDILDEVEKAGDGIGFDLNLASQGENTTPINGTRLRNVSSRSNRLNAPFRFQGSGSI